MIHLVLADVHANRPALEAVLEHARGQYDRVLFCGDAVGYGPDPGPVIEILASLPLAAAVRGNHDRAVLTGDCSDFSDMARLSVAWTAERLGEESRQWLASLPTGPEALDPDLLVCHGHPQDEDLYLMGWPLVHSALRAVPGTLSLHGHTHVPAVWWEAPEIPEGIAGGLVPPGERSLPPGGAATVNPGSVGQPRDGDPRAAYLLLDPATRRLSWRRVPYDAGMVARRVREEGLPVWLGERLLEGR